MNELKQAAIDNVLNRALERVESIKKNYEGGLARQLMMASVLTNALAHAEAIARASLTAYSNTCILPEPAPGGDQKGTGVFQSLLP